jgi:hypothetical protein
MTPQDQTSSIAKEKLKFTGLNHDYWGVRELETFLVSLGTNYLTAKHLFWGYDLDNVHYALNQLGSCANHSTQTLQNMTMSDQVN